MVDRDNAPVTNYFKYFILSMVEGRRGLKDLAPLETSKNTSQPFGGYLRPENSHLIMCFCLSREKLAVARLQREVAQRTSQGAMVSFGSSPTL